MTEEEFSAFERLADVTAHVGATAFSSETADACRRAAEHLCAAVAMVRRFYEDVSVTDRDDQPDRLLTGTEVAELEAWFRAS